MAVVRIVKNADATFSEEREYSRVPQVGERVRIGAKRAKVIDVLHEIRGSAIDATITVSSLDS